MAHRRRDRAPGGDGTPGNPYLCGEANPYEVFRAEVDAPPVLDADNVLVDGSRHYGHLEVNVTTNAQGQWQCTLTPVYIFVSKAKNGVCGKFERRVFNDVITIDARGRRVETTDRTIPWWRNPSVKATVTSASTGDMNTHYMNKDAGDRFLFVNHNADTRTNPAYLYSIPTLLGLDVTDPDDWHEVTITNAPALFGADIMNVKLSGEATRTPTLYVGTDDGRLRVFRLSHDGFRIVSALRTFEPTQIGALCGLSATPTKFRNFEVTRDGAFAFMCHDGTDGDAKRSDLKIVRTPPSRGSVYFLR